MPALRSSRRAVSLRAALLLIGASLGLPCHAETPQRPELLVFAAASLTEVLGELARDWGASSGARVRLSFAASSLLARQIEAGGRADVFICADQEWMDYLAARALIVDSTRRDLVGNSLVLITPPQSNLRLEISEGFALADALRGGRLSVADPDTVPAGRYAHAALASLGVWQQVKDRLARADNVRAALNLVARGETPLGIVYATDAWIARGVRIVGTFPEGSHPPIRYPGAATSSAGPEALAFLDFLGSGEAAAVWKRHGFRTLR
jgi:molybdate transport system substrate-binding protein